MKDKDFDCVKMMRDIRDKLSQAYNDSDAEDKELALRRKKYGIAH